MPGFQGKKSCASSAELVAGCGLLGLEHSRSEPMVKPWGQECAEQRVGEPAEIPKQAS